MDYRAGEIQVRFLNDRINLTEKHLSEVCQSMSSYTRKLAGARDAADDLVKSLLRFGQEERQNTTLQTAIFSLADHLGAVQDHRDAQVRRMEAKGVKKLAEYGSITKQAREDLRKGFEARTQEMTRRRQVDRVHGQYPMNWHRSSATDSLRDSSDLPSPSSLETKMDHFEQQKIEDIRQVLLDFVNVELLFHAKAVELFSSAMASITSIDQEQDLESFRSCLRAPMLHQRHLPQFRSAPDLPSLGASHDGTRIRPATLPTRRSLSSRRDNDNSDDELTDSKEDDVSQSHYVGTNRRRPHSLAFS